MGFQDIKNQFIKVLALYALMLFFAPFCQAGFNPMGGYGGASWIEEWSVALFPGTKRFYQSPG